MEIGEKLRNLRTQKNLTREELGEGVDSSKGYTSQLERDLNSPSMEAFFPILEVLGVTSERFSSQQPLEQKTVYNEEESTLYCDEEHGCELKWLVPASSERKMGPIIITLDKNGEYKVFESSLLKTFTYVVDSSVHPTLGEVTHITRKGQIMYYQATGPHQISNNGRGESCTLTVAAGSYL